MALPAAVHPRVDVGAVNQPYDQRPRLFRVPGPVATPGIIGPHCAQDRAEGQEREAHHNGLVSQLVNLLEAGKRGVDGSRRNAPALRPFLQQIHHAQASGHRESGITGQRD